MNQENVSATSTSTVADTSDMRIKLSEILRDDKLRQQLISFVKLDMMTMKSNLRGSNFYWQLAIVIYSTFATGYTTSGFGLGAMIALISLDLPFRVGEKTNMDVLYASLSCNRNMVVLGRYLYLIAFNIVTSIVTLILCLLLQLLPSLFIQGFGMINIARWFAFTPACWIYIAQALLLPLWFSQGSSKTKFEAGFIIVMGVVAYFVTVIASNSQSGNFDSSLINSTDISSLALLISLIVMYISYRYSLKYYLARDF